MDRTLDRDLPAGLVRAAIAGDDVAFARLVAVLHDDLVRVAYVVCGDADLAQDAAQSTWSIAWRKLHDVREPDRIRGWLATVAANEARQLVRGRMRRRVREIHLDVDAGPGAVVADPGGWRDARLDLERVLDDLSADDRRLVALRYAGGLSSAEISSELGVSAPAVRMRLSRLLGRLREELGDD